MAEISTRIYQFGNSVKEPDESSKILTEKTNDSDKKLKPENLSEQGITPKNVDLEESPKDFNPAINEHVTVEDVNKPLNAMPEAIPDDVFDEDSEEDDSSLLKGKDKSALKKKKR